MQNIRLITPSDKYLGGYLEACKLAREKGVAHQYAMHNPDTFQEWKDTIFTKYEELRRGENLPEGFVPESVFWLVNDTEFLGAGSIRHRLTEKLEKFGGHIGYGINPNHWRKGYGTYQLELLLEEAKKLEIPRVLLTCDTENAASWRVMEKNGAVLQDVTEILVNDKPRVTRRYWIEV